MSPDDHPAATPPPGRPGPRGLTYIIVAVAAVVVGIAAWFLTPGPSEAPDQGTGTALTAADIGGPFQLTDHHGKRVSDGDFRGRYMLVFFGFTHCPDVCPSTLRDISMALDHLDDEAEAIQPLFITVDPERDDVEAMADYVTAFDSRILGLTGTREEIDRATAAYRIYSARIPLGDDDYTVDHSAFTYLLDREGRYLAHFSFGVDPEEMAEGIEHAIEQWSHAS
jgi:cytochrome oxidase Cu insertion factor (SCO1/SenC/PrrC family)